MKSSKAKKNIKKIQARARARANGDIPTSKVILNQANLIMLLKQCLIDHFLRSSSLAWKTLTFPGCPAVTLEPGVPQSSPVPTCQRGRLCHGKAAVRDTPAPALDGMAGVFRLQLPWAAFLN